MKKTFYVPWVVTFLALLLTACSGAPARQIASVPRLTPIARFPGSESIVYHAYIELQVANVDAAAERAAAIAERYGGYYTGGQSWYVDGRKQTTVELAVPTVNFERMRQGVLELGVLVNESVGSHPAAPSSKPQYSSLTLQLRPDESAWLPAEPPAYRPDGWDPAATFRRAFGVFLAIFGFLADILIWIVVVLGPFLLIAAVIWRLLRRRRSA